MRPRARENAFGLLAGIQMLTIKYIGLTTNASPAAKPNQAVGWYVMKRGRDAQSDVANGCAATSRVHLDYPNGNRNRFVQAGNK